MIQLQQDADMLGVWDERLILDTYICTCTCMLDASPIMAPSLAGISACPTAGISQLWALLGDAVDTCLQQSGLTPVTVEMASRTEWLLLLA